MLLCLLLLLNVHQLLQLGVQGGLLLHQRSLATLVRNVVDGRIQKHKYGISIEIIVLKSESHVEKPVHSWYLKQKRWVRRTSRELIRGEERHASMATAKSDARVVSIAAAKSVGFVSGEGLDAWLLVTGIAYAHLNLGGRLLGRRRRPREHLLSSRSLFRRLAKLRRLSVERRRLPPELVHPILLHAPRILRTPRQLLALSRRPLLYCHGAVTLVG